MRENYKKTFYITLLLSIFFILLSILILYYPKALITTVYYTLGIITGISSYKISSGKEKLFFS